MGVDDGAGNHEGSDLCSAGCCDAATLVPRWLRMLDVGRQQVEPRWYYPSTAREQRQMT